MKETSAERLFIRPAGGGGGCESGGKRPQNGSLCWFYPPWPLRFMAAVGQGGLFTLLTKAERSTGRQEGSEAILHGRIVCLSDGRA